MMAGVHAGHRLVIAGSSRLSVNSGKLVNHNSNMRYLHVGRRFTHWKKVNGCQQSTDRGYAIAGCRAPLLQG